MYPLFPFEPEEAVIEPRQIVRPAENFPKCCLAVFSAPIFEKIRTRPEAEEIASVGNANGEVPVYQILHRGTPIAAYMTPIGAPACAGTMEEVMALGADPGRAVGSCGVLDKTIPDGAVIRLAAPTAMREPPFTMHLPPNIWRRTRICFAWRVKYSMRTACRSKRARSGRRMRFTVKRRAGCGSSVKRAVLRSKWNAPLFLP